MGTAREDAFALQSKYGAGGSGTNTGTSYPFGTQAPATAGPTAAQSAQTAVDSGKAKAEADAALQAQQASNAAGSGYQVGERLYTHPDVNDVGAHDPVGIESRGERYINSQQNFAYGRDPLAAQEAVDRSRAAEARGQTMAQNYAIPIGGTARTAADMAMRTAFRGGPETDFAKSANARMKEQNAYSSLMDVGQAPISTAAQAQLRAGTNQAMANQLALARSGRGAGGNASATRQAMFANADISQQAANESAMLRASEENAYRQRQLGAFGAAGQLAGQMRGADVGQAQFLTDAQLRQQQLNDAAGLGYTGLALQGYGQQADVGMGGEELAAKMRDSENAIRMAELNGSMGYEHNLTAMGGGAPQESGIPWGGIIGAGAGAVGGFFAGGPAGSVALGTAGYGIGSQFDR